MLIFWFSKKSVSHNSVKNLDIFYHEGGEHRRVNVSEAFPPSCRVLGCYWEFLSGSVLEIGRGKLTENFIKDLWRNEELRVVQRIRNTYQNQRDAFSEQKWKQFYRSKIDKIVESLRKHYIKRKRSFYMAVCLRQTCKNRILFYYEVKFLDFEKSKTFWFSENKRFCRKDGEKPSGVIGPISISIFSKLSSPLSSSKSPSRLKFFHRNLSFLKITDWNFEIQISFLWTEFGFHWFSRLRSWKRLPLLSLLSQTFLNSQLLIVILPRMVFRFKTQIWSPKIENVCCASFSSVLQVWQFGVWPLAVFVF